MKRVLPWLLALLLGTFGWWIGRRQAPAPPDGAPADTAAEQEETATVWTCSMHPQIRMPEPGKCPICFMDLIPVSDSDGEEEEGPRTLTMSPAAAALADIQTAPVARRAVAHEIRFVGKVDFDETRVATIAAWTAGRLDRLFVDYTGVEVHAGDHMVEMYSPPLYAAQQELLQAISTARRLEDSPIQILREASDANVRSAREKLLLLGLTPEQVEEVVQRGTPDTHLVINAPMGGIVVHKQALEGMYVQEGTPIYTIADLRKVWLLLDAYEADLAWLRYGQDVEFQVAAWPGEVFHGRVAFIDPVLDNQTRTVKVRVNVDNPDLRLKPSMFVHARVDAVLTPAGKVLDPSLAGMWMCPMHPEVLSETPGACPECGMDLLPVEELGFVTQPAEDLPLVIPHTAPLITGRRAVVYVKRPDSERPSFEGREIVLGPRAGDWYIVEDGLQEGEEVVVKGNFKIDSELQIRARPSMMSPEGGAPPPGHQHGASGAPAGGQGGADSEPPDSGPTSFETPREFREQLGAVLRGYLSLQQALAADDDQAAAEAAAQALQDLERVDMALLKGEAHMAWMENLGSLQSDLERVASASGLEPRRAALAPLTRSLIQAVERFGSPEDLELKVFHCPMAFEGKGADWLQEDSETANPYFGSKMLRCGDATRSLKR